MTEQIIPTGQGQQQSPESEIGVLPHVNFLRAFNVDNDIALGKAVEAAVAEIGRLAEVYAEKYNQKLALLAVPELMEALREAEEIDSKAGKIRQHAEIRAFTGDNDFAQVLFTHLDMALRPMNIVEQEVKSFETQKIRDLFQDEQAIRFRPFFRKILESPSRTKPTHGVPIDDIWKTAHRNLCGLYRGLLRQVSSQRGVVTGVEKKHLITYEFGKTHGEVFATILSTFHQMRQTLSRWNEKVSPLEDTCHSNQISLDELTGLREAVRESLNANAHQYWAWKSNRLGFESAPAYQLGRGLASLRNKVYPWVEARDLIKRTFGMLSPAFQELAENFFSEQRAHGYGTRDVCLNGDQNYTPVLILSYWGTLRDLITLPHELGHGIHNVLSSTAQERWSVRANRLVNETVALFCERLGFRALIDKAEPENAGFLKACRADSAMMVVYNEMANLDFEISINKVATNGHLEANKACELWIDIMKAYYGEAVTVDETHKYDWTDTPQLFEDEYYNYVYAAAALLAWKLEQDFNRRGDEFVADFTDMLRAGGTKTTHELLAPFGIEVMNKVFWGEALAGLQAEVDWVRENYIGEATNGKAAVSKVSGGPQI